VAISPINGPLLQRASNAAVVTASTNVTLSIPLAAKLPDGFTGFTAERTSLAALFTSAFSTVVNNFYERADIPIKNTGCVGTCLTKVVGAGFAVDCSSYQVVVNTLAGNESDPVWITGVDVFESTFKWPGGDSLDVNGAGKVSLNVQYKSGGNCEATLKVTNCTLSSATVEYGAIINGNQSTTSLLQNSSFQDDKIISEYSIVEDYWNNANTTIGGLALALSNRFNSVVNVHSNHISGASVVMVGPLGNQFVVRGDDSGYVGTCGIQFNDPTSNLLANARELLFRTAVAAANSSNIQHIPASQVQTVAVYQSHYLYLFL
jgi:hypothetical protein